jgi:D-tagatose-1,6-bisphosphate aldolase subunit GatZ/KbaZ
VWPRVIALVVQPGVEFDHDAVVGYERKKASALVEWLRASRRRLCLRRTQRTTSLPQAYVELVEDGFAILKVGPADVCDARGVGCARRYGVATDCLRTALAAGKRD